MASAARSSVNLRTVALPAEHGGWGFLLEPLLLGLLVAPSPAGVCLAAATSAGFLVRQPLRIALTDRRRGRSTVRTIVAVRVAAAYGVIAVASFVVTLWLGGLAFLLPLFLALPFAVVFLYFDMTQPGRTVQAEFAAPLVLAAVAPSLALLGGWTPPFALTLWALLAARTAPTILYVRARLRLDRARAHNLRWPLAAHGLAIVLVLALAWLQLAPWLAVLPFVVLLMRAAWFLAPQRPAVPVKTIGFIELGLGIGTVLVIALGYWLMGV